MSEILNPTVELDESLKNSLSHLKENDARRKRWAHLTEKKSRYDRNFVSNEKGLAPAMRRNLEIMMDNVVEWSMTGEARAADVAPITENVRNFLRDPSSVKENAVTTSAISAFTTVAFPLIRRVYPNLISNFLVAVQPIPLPTALLFFLDFKYGTSFAPVAQGDLLNDRTVVSTQTRMMRARQYASGVITGEAVGTGDGATTVFYLAYFPIKSATTTMYVNGVSAPATVDLETGKVTMNTAPGNGTALTADYSLVFEGTGPIPGVELAMSQDSVTAEKKALKAAWSIEAAQDAAVYHGIDVDAELLNVMAEEITREIDGLIISDLVTAAGSGAGNTNWSTTVGSGYSPIEWQRTLLDAFIDSSQLIHTQRLRYANWIVAGDDVIVRLQKMAGFNPNIGSTPGGGIAGTFDAFNTPVVNGQGPAFLGTLNSKYAIFHDPVHLTAGTALMGYRGQSMIDTGYIYAPYQPLYVTPVLIDPNDMTPRRGVMTRYARKLISNQFYSTVTITG